VSSQKIKEHVKKRYSERAIRSQTRCGCSSSCCGPSRDSWAKEVGYTLQELEKLPDQALSAAAGCGNPTALASLQEGEVVLDLGSGGGIDVILASKKIGASGIAIGVDMTDEMIELSRRNALEAGATNTEFRKGDIESLPVEDESVDVVISNCVINLAPDKDKVFNEVYRVLKPGGRFLVSDIVTVGDLPDEVKNDLDKWAECVGGAIDGTTYIGKLRKAGFKDVKELSRRGFGGIFSAEIQGYKPHSEYQECC
jgi:SAM-dependent methyltransferase